MVGAGPAGLCLAAELARLGVDVVILERRTDPEAGTRAIGVHPPVLAALEPSGATERILAVAARIPRGIARSRGRTLAEVRFDRLDSHFPFVAAVPQAVTEAAISAAAPQPVRGAEVRAITARLDRVSLRVRVGGSDAGSADIRSAGAGSTGAGSTGADSAGTESVDPDSVGADSVEVELSARAVVVAAGASGRNLALPFARVHARSYADRYLMADLPEAPEQPADTAIVTLDAAGVLESFPLPGGGRRLVAWDGADDGASRAADAPELRAERLRLAVAARAGESALAARIESATAFGIRRVLLRRMRSGRVFVIGDAAHEVSPIGGQGMNLGLLDAATLAPTLARRLRHEGAANELAQWEQRRLASARTAARLAGLNTALGRPRSPRMNGALTAAIGVVASGRVARLAARAYAMGFDRDTAAELGNRA